MSLEAVYTSSVVTVSLDDSVLDVAAVFREEGVGSAVVTNANGEIAGIVTDRDLVVFGQNFVETLESTAINEVMSPVVITVSPETETRELAAAMREEGIRRVPVVEDGDLVGIVTLDDLICRLADELNDLAAVIESESRGRIER